MSDDIATTIVGAAFSASTSRTSRRSLRARFVNALRLACGNACVWLVVQPNTPGRDVVAALIHVRSNQYAPDGAKGSWWSIRSDGLRAEQPPRGAIGKPRGFAVEEVLAADLVAHRRDLLRRSSGPVRRTLDMIINTVQ